MSAPFKIIYGHDPLCGWCYGFIPAMRALERRHPQAEVEVIGGGLFSGDRTPQYAEMGEYIPNAFNRIEVRSGRRYSNDFARLLDEMGERTLRSAGPTLALELVAQIAPHAKSEFAHRLQEAYFEDGMPLDEAATYDTVTDSMGLPPLDTTAILAATDDTPEVAASYARSRALDISAYPTIIVQDSEGRELGRVASEYVPDAFVAEVERIAGLLETV